MDNTSSSKDIISNLNADVESLMEEIQQIRLSPVSSCNAQTLEKWEREIHQKTAKLADLISGIKLQEMLSSQCLEQDEQALLKLYPQKMKNMGRRTLMIRLLGGTQILFSAPYYHQKTNLKKMQKKKGFYPRLSLLGIHDRCTPALSSLVSLFATAACSLEESQRLLETLYRFNLDIKTIRMVCKRFSLRARFCFKAGSVPLTEEFKGKRVVISTDGGRVRTRVNQRGKKTRKNRSRYKTDWREPKLILAYVVNENGEKDRKISPMMDASLEGPDATFAMLLYYLKKLGVGQADQLLFVSDGAPWIWDRVADLIKQLGIKVQNCWMALDFYHAVEHLSSIADQKKWKSAEKKQWVNKQRRRLLKGKLDIFIEEIECVCKNLKNNLLIRERDYFRNHLPHMRYKEIKDKKLPIGSGGVESGIRRVINLRLKGPGIFWHEDMADSMLLLRSYYKAGRWNMLENMAVSGGLVVN